jgi:hypothetical protein
MDLSINNADVCHKVYTEEEFNKEFIRDDYGSIHKRELVCSYCDGISRYPHGFTTTKCKCLGIGVPTYGPIIPFHVTLCHKCKVTEFDIEKRDLTVFRDVAKQKGDKWTNIYIELYVPPGLQDRFRLEVDLLNRKMK